MGLQDILEENRNRPASAAPVGRLAAAVNPKTPKPQKPQNPNSIKLLPWIRDLGKCIVQPKNGQNGLPNAIKSSHLM